MSDQQPAKPEQPPAPEGDYRKAADTLRDAIDKEANRSNRAQLAQVLGEMAIRMTAARSAARLAADAPTQGLGPRLACASPSARRAGLLSACQVRA